MSGYHGSCHCGQVRLRVAVDIDAVVICDRSLCTKKVIVHAPVPDDALAARALWPWPAALALLLAWGAWCARRAHA